MSDVDLNLQLRFLKQLDEALDEALTRHDGESDAIELQTMRAEVLKAQQIVGGLMDEDVASGNSPSLAATG